MKEYRSSTGERRLWFEENEIEWMMEDELRKAGLFPCLADSVVDLESLLEIQFGVKLDLHAVLDDDVLGVTHFLSGKKPLVSINKDLTSQAETGEAPSGIFGRWRATMAHEAGHVVLHRGLVEEPYEQGSFFSEITKESTSSLLRCLKRDVSFRRGDYDWKEVQANRGMAALLMPARVFRELTLDIFKANNFEGLSEWLPETSSAEFSNLLRELSRRCEVSQEAARIRLESLGLARRSDETMFG